MDQHQPDQDQIPETRVTVWPASHPWGRTRRALLGLGFIVLVVALLVVAVGGYLQWYTPRVWVTVSADHTGLQLDKGADVKFRGVVVGQVRSISADGSRASLRVGIDPGQVGRIPAGVRARFVPKTLFGEKYVDLVAPAHPGPGRVHAGEVIGQDTSARAVELERVVDRLLPVLQAVQPQKLDVTLTAVADALRGRGERIGDMLTTLDSYLSVVNRQLPTIRSDLQRLASVLGTYSAAWSDVAEVLSNLTVTSGTVTQQRVALASSVDEVTGFADTASGFVLRHEGRLVQVGRVSRPLLGVLAEYAPEYPCLTAGVVALQPRAERVFATGRLHITLEIVRAQGKYVAGEEPVYGADIGPSCHGLPDNPPVPAPEYPVVDGYQDNGTGGTGGAAAMGYAGTPEEQGVVKPLVAATTGRNVSQVSDLDALLWGSLMRGSEVNAT